MQAITTTYIRYRFRASCASGSVYHNQDDSLSDDENHAAAVKKLLVKVGWIGTYTGGTIPGGAIVWVCHDKYRPLVIEVKEV